MKSIKLLILLSCLLMVLGPGSQPVESAFDTAQVTTLASEDDNVDNGVHLNKQAHYNENTKKVDITLEAFVTGSVTTDTRDVPVDIVLVLDQSGSMSYSMSNGGPTKVNVLKNSVRNFVNAVEEKAKGPDGRLGTEDDIDYRIAMVGFASYDVNSELLTGPNYYYKDYIHARDSDYRDSLLSVNNTSNQIKINNAINSIDAYGSTRTDIGMYMAQRIMQTQPTETAREKVVIMFTDGIPSALSNEVWEDNANRAIGHSKNLKDIGVTVYTVGIFNGANPYSDSLENRFMNYVSSNFPQATDIHIRVEKESNSHYLTANNEAGLMNVFTQISSQIGGSAVQASSETVILDELAPQLQLPAGFNSNDVRYEVYNYIGQNNNFNAPESWRRANDQLNLNVNIEGNKIQVSGFDYASNFVANDATNGRARGKKLVLKFSSDVKEDFIGGNQVVTNGSNSGFYLPESDTPSRRFVMPKVDIPLRFDTVINNVGQYYQTKTALNELVSNNGGSFLINNQSYNLDGINNQYVDIIYQIKRANGQEIEYQIKAGETTINKTLEEISLQLAADETVNYQVSVVPVNAGSRQSLVINKTGTIYVWYPKFKLTNETIYLGETTDLTQRYGLVEWYHDHPAAVKPKRILTADDFQYGLTLSQGTVLSEDKSQYQPTEDSIVTVVPYIRQSADCLPTNTDCFMSLLSDKTIFDSGNNNNTFTIFVIPLQLTISKQVENPDENQSFIFQVTADNGYQQTVVVQGNGTVTLTGLAIGNYTVNEDQQWSYRYQAVDGQQTIKLDADTTHGQIRVVNRKDNDQWLSGENYAINRFDSPPVFGGEPNE